MALQASSPPVTICRQRVANLNRLSGTAECLLTNGSKVTLAPLIAAHIAPTDELSFPLLNSSVATAEILVTKNSLVGSGREVYQAPIGYVTQPKKDKRDEFFVAAEVRPANLGIASIFLPCRALREYFYRIPEREGSIGRQTLYDVCQVPCPASPGELRVAFKLRQLELEAKYSPRGEHALLERAFNILGDPGLRACYDVLLKDPEAPALFPYGGFGSLLASGERSRDAKTFFARRIIAFLPERHKRRFHAPLRKCEFYCDRALYRDVRRRLELWLDPAVLHQVWDATWNRWKHLLGTKMEVNATFVKSGKYRWYRSEWQLVTWETALPSPLEIELPADFGQQVEAAKRTYHRFGQYSPALDKIRALIERKPLEKAELERMLSAMNVPGDFDIAQINWKPDYDPFFYQQLSRRAADLLVPRRVHFRTGEDCCGRDATTRQRHVLVRKTPKHGCLSRRLHESVKRRHSAQSVEYWGAARVPWPGHSRQQSPQLGEGIEGTNRGNPRFCNSGNYGRLMPRRPMINTEWQIL